MAFWHGVHLHNECLAKDLIVPFDKNRIVHSAYELGVGDEAYVTSVSVDNPRLSLGAAIFIPPGQFGLLITHEQVYVPADAIAFISIKAGTKFEGLVNVSGFHVDPGYRGYLKFSVYNAGSKTIVLDQQQPLFLIWYASLTGTDEKPYIPRPAGQNKISSIDIGKIKGEVASPAELRKSIETLATASASSVANLKTELDTRLRSIESEVKQRFEASENTKTINRTMIFLVISALITLLFSGFLKPYLDSTVDKVALGILHPPACVQSTNAVVGTLQDQAVIVLPVHIGAYLLGAGVLSSCFGLFAAILVWKRVK